MRKICVVTGSRAEYGILRGLMKAIKDDPELTWQVIATNQHLSKLQGETYKEIEREKREFEPIEKILHRLEETEGIYLKGYSELCKMLKEK